MIADLLHKIAVMEQPEEHPYSPRASQAGPERCVRAMTYHRVGTARDKPTAGRMYHVFDDSNWHAELMGQWIAHTAYDLHSKEMSVICYQDDAMIVRGHLDGIITDPLGTDRVLELKALNHFTWQRYATGEEFPEDYICQTCCYIRGVQQLNPAITEAVLLLKNKNTSQYVEFLLRYHSHLDLGEIVSLTDGTGETVKLGMTRPQIIAKAVEKFKEVERHAEAGTLPPWPDGFKAGDYPCSYCPYEGTCWSTFVVDTTKVKGPVVLSDPNAEAFAEQYLAIVERAKVAEAEKATFRDRLLSIMRGQQATKGVAGRFTVTRSVQQRPGRVNEEALDLATKAKLDAARGQIQVVEVLRVSTQRAGEGV